MSEWDDQNPPAVTTAALRATSLASANAGAILLVTMSGP